MRSRVPLFALLLIAGSLALPLAAHAGIPFFGPIIDKTWMDPSTQAQCALGWGALIVVINNIIELLITLAIVFVAPLMIAYAGFLLVVSQGDSGKRTEARKILTNTIFGIVIALAGWMIVDAIMLALYNPDTPINGGKLGAWSDLIGSRGELPCLKVAGVPSPAVGQQPVVTVTPGPTGKSGLNISSAVSYLDSNAKPSSIAKCALFVRKALSAGGLTSLDRIHPESAYEYGPTLTSLGFTTVNSSGYTPQTGDVIVFQPVAKHPDGHIEMYDGRQWVSDFKQNNVLPSTDYRGGSYTIYRS